MTARVQVFLHGEDVTGRTTMAHWGWFHGQQHTHVWHGDRYIGSYSAEGDKLLEGYDVTVTKEPIHREDHPYLGSA